ncbi:MAG TPA: hypothetical protein VFZ21_28675 [Gemmatimonadaceae bacterium]|jgi:hypothetical protein|nr:hypothetical protein [Gemmatimonadaceae bacterium]
MQEIPIPPPAPAPAAPPSIQVFTTQGASAGGADPAAVYEGLRAQRRELENQLERLQDRRDELSEELQDPMVQAANRTGLEQRITEIDARILSVERQIAESDLRVSQAAGIPGAVLPDRPEPPAGPPEEAFVLGGIFIIVVLFPIAIAYSRRLWKRGTAAVAALPKELMERLTRLEQGVDAVAMEVERIGEGQRYMARLMTEDGTLRAVGAGAAEPVPVKAREKDPEYRR